MKLNRCVVTIEEDRLKVDIQKVCMEYKIIKKWVYILHDKDVTRNHYHIYLIFGNHSVDSAIVAKWFNLAWTDEDGKEHTGENIIYPVRSSDLDIYLYLIQYEKYSPSKVVSNFDFAKELSNYKLG